MPGQLQRHLQGRGKSQKALTRISWSLGLCHSASAVTTCHSEQTIHHHSITSEQIVSTTISGSTNQSFPATIGYNIFSSYHTSSHMSSEKLYYTLQQIYALEMNNNHQTQSWNNVGISAAAILKMLLECKLRPNVDMMFKLGWLWVSA